MFSTSSRSLTHSNLDHHLHSEAQKLIRGADYETMTQALAAI
jgi:hypothetical protein